MRAAIISNRRITGLLVNVLAAPGAEMGPLWQAQHQATLAARPRTRVGGAGAKHRLVFVDRLLATLVHLCHGVTHDVLACWFEVGTAPSLPGPWVRFVRCWPSGDVLSAPGCVCGRWPR